MWHPLVLKDWSFCGFELVEQKNKWFQQKTAEMSDTIVILMILPIDYIQLNEWNSLLVKT